MPRVFQQIDWSNGGDGIVVRNDIKNVAQLKGKTVALSKFSPSHYFLLNMLLLMTIGFLPYPTGVLGEALARGQGTTTAAVFYGVTMAEQGVSQLVSVNFQEADRMVA